MRPLPSAASNFLSFFQGLTSLSGLGTSRSGSLAQQLQSLLSGGQKYDKDTFESPSPAKSAPASVTPSTLALGATEPAVTAAPSLTEAPVLTESEPTRAAEPSSWVQAAPVVQQLGALDSGAAAVASLIRAQGGGQGLSDAELVQQVSDDLKARYGTDVSAQAPRPGDLLGMLNDHGMQVVAASRDIADMDKHLDAGRKLMVQVDLAGTGENRWVVVDGKDAGGNFQVKDPSGNAFTMTRDQLDQAMGSVRRGRAIGGGFMAIDPAGTRSLTADQVQKLLGDDPTRGFKTRAGGTEISV